MNISHFRFGTRRAGPACTPCTGTLPLCAACIFIQLKLSPGPGMQPWGCGTLRWVAADKRSTHCQMLNFPLGKKAHQFQMWNFPSDWGMPACAGRPCGSSEVCAVWRQAGRQRRLWLHGQGMAPELLSLSLDATALNLCWQSLLIGLEPWERRVPTHPFWSHQQGLQSTGKLPSLQITLWFLLFEPCNWLSKYNFVSELMNYSTDIVNNVA